MSEFHNLINSNLLQGRVFFDKSLENLTWLKVFFTAKLSNLHKLTPFVAKPPSAL